MSNDKDIRFAERTKPSRGDTEPKPVVVPPEPTASPQEQQLRLTPFKDGIVLRHSINPRNPKTRVLHDATGTPLAVVLLPEVAELICNAVTLFFIEQSRKHQAANQQLDTLTDAAVPEADGGTAASEIVKKLFEPVALPPQPQDVTDIPPTNEQP